MRIVRFSDGDNPRYGALDESSENIVALRNDPLFAPVEPSGQIFELEDVRLLSPVIPRSKVVGVGKNYADHAREMGGEAPDHPILFLKPNTSVIGPDDPIVLPPWSQEVHHEAELAVVIKTLAKDVPVDRVGDVILGYTCANDVSARDAQRADGQWTRAKGFDTSCPLGPWIEVGPDLDVTDLRVTSSVNGELRQSDTTAHMITPVRELVAYISRVFTLLPGDVIITGTPAGVGPIVAGDRVDISVSGIGTLSNPVVAG
ncbi:MAG: fumarylacetoacetate hydrolase family protein [Actinomyces sp.]|jgi:2-keto-4-pentenoate hydratase/2-oxohepta-3-ene-1,7-dioic acid hydratase in catechol pathway|nr:fumarylacetoacetate hydrolase family protein [Actinomyces sp.]MCI1641573.1 fumarylacetoacetate hydrolase family protein [Actinomyces sp.]MCI1661689.1 fumarylacetoacetate hydrolase family protein [Actinomyces sp.]MCI1691135.1 fumarylacetoacetate hydrolase family protein [Actinomyces sp.]